MIEHRQGTVNATFVGTDAEYAAPNFIEQYARILERNPRLQAIAYADQVHGDASIEVRSPIERIYCAGKCDALWTRAPDTALLIRTADCIPILFYDTASNCIGAVHAGWRGLEKKILSQVISRCGVSAATLRIVVGPFIGAHSYEVGEEVAGIFDARCSKSRGRGKFLLDLRSVIAAECEALQIDRQNIVWFDTDTYRDENWYSARGGDSKRNLAFIFRQNPDENPPPRMR